MQAEIRKLDEQLSAHLEKDHRYPGRHRSQRGKVPARQVADARGFDLRPDPLSARSAAEFIAALWKYKAWSGDPSWRQMATAAGQAVVHSTMHAAMNGETLPKLDVVKAIIIGCGGGTEDLSAFATAWRRLDATRPGRRQGPEFLAAPVAQLPEMAGR